jgi:hypothetical protein
VLHFDSHSSAKLALKSLQHRLEAGERVLSLRWAELQEDVLEEEARMVFVSKLPPGTSLLDVEQAFAKFGKVLRVSRVELEWRAPHPCSG